MKTAEQMKEILISKSPEYLAELKKENLIEEQKWKQKLEDFKQRTTSQMLKKIEENLVESALHGKSSILLPRLTSIEVSEIDHTTFYDYFNFFTHSDKWDSLPSYHLIFSTRTLEPHLKKYGYKCKRKFYQKLIVSFD